MYPKSPLFQKAIACLQSLPNLKIEADFPAEPYFTKDVLADGYLRISTSHASADYVCEIKTGVTGELIDTVAEYFTNLGKRLTEKLHPLLVTQGLSNLVIERLIERNIEFIDVDGSIYFNRCGVYVCVIVKKPPKINETISSEITTSMLLVMYVVLVSYIKDGAYSWTQARIRGLLRFHCDMSMKTSNAAVKKLIALSYFEVTANGLQIANYVRFFERWEIGYAERMYKKNLLGKFTSIVTDDFSSVRSIIEEYAMEHKCFIGGELAASHLTPYLRPNSAILHVSDVGESRKLATLLKLKPDPQGNIAVMLKFYQDLLEKQLDHSIILVHPLLIHAELVRTGDSRLKETADIIYDKYIDKL